MPNYAFTRTSVAYFNGNQLPDDTPATCSSLRCSVSDGAYEGGDYIVWPIGTNFYATRASDRARVHKWNSGTSSWDQLSVVPALVHCLFELQSGRLLAGGEDGKVYLSDTSGDNWAQVLQLSAAPDEQNSPFCMLDPGYFHQASNGTIICGDYSNTMESRKIYRSAGSDPGTTWEVVHNASKGDHYHACIHVQALSRWIIAHGDATPYGWMTRWGDFPVCLTDNHQYVLYSDDDGQAQTWKAFFTPGDEPDFQPIAFLDYGDANGKVLFGSDRQWQVGTFDAATGEIKQLLNNMRREAVRCFVISLYYDADEELYYACQLDNSASPDRHAGIWVSKDLTDWALYHTFTNNERSATIVGKRGGKIHARVMLSDGSLAHFAISPATAVSSPTDANYLVEPGVTNLLSTPGQSSVEDEPPYDWSSFWQAYTWYGAIGTRVQNPVRVGYYAFRVDSTRIIDELRWTPMVQWDPPNTWGQYRDKCAFSVGVLGTGVSIPAGSYATGRIALTTTNLDREGNYRADRHLVCRVGFRNQIGEDLPGHVDQRVHLEPGVWKEVELATYHVLGPSSETVVIAVECAQEGLGARTLIADCAQIAVNTGGTSWQVGGTDREDALLVADPGTQMESASWTNVFKCEPSLESLHLPIGCCVRTWTNGTDYLKLLWNPDGSFDLEIKKNGSVFDTLSVPVPYFPRRGQILVGLVVETSSSPQSRVTVYIAAGQGGSTIPSATTGVVAEDWGAYFTGALMTAKSGNESPIESPQDVFPHWLDSSFDLFDSTAKTAAQIRDIMNNTT